MKVIISGKTVMNGIAHVGDANKQVVGIVFKDDAEKATVIQHLTNMPPNEGQPRGYLMYPDEMAKADEWMEKFGYQIMGREARGQLESGFADKIHIEWSKTSKELIILDAMTNAIYNLIEREGNSCAGEILQELLCKNYNDQNPRSTIAPETNWLGLFKPKE